MNLMRSIPLSLVAVLVLSGCGPADAPRTSGAPEISPTLQLSADSLTATPEGIWQYDREVGAGDPAAPGDLVTVHYTGWLASNGARFDGSTPERPFTFTLGAGEVIPGWDAGVEGMQPGGRRVVVIPPQLAYGERGVGVLIPPNSTLAFEIQLLETNPR
jgi:FKBP-type peptidyl-prolyl cis-trans isomerase